MLSIESNAFSCVVPGCFEGPGEPAAGVCRSHFAHAPEPARARFLATLRRVSHLREMWKDEARYAAIVGSGRYLKLVNAMGCAEEALDAAARRLTLAVIAAQTRSPMESPRLRA